MAGSFTITGTKPGLPSGSQTIGPLTVAGTIVLGQTIDVALASGDNTVTVPASASAVLIVPPAGNTATLKYRTVAGDSGVFISKTQPTLIAFDAANLPATFLVNAGAAIAALTEISFI